jgi:hypothetical protein
MNLKAHHTEHLLVLVFLRVRIGNIQFILDTPQKKNLTDSNLANDEATVTCCYPATIAVTLPPKTVLTQSQLFAV